MSETTGQSAERMASDETCSYVKNWLSHMDARADVVMYDEADNKPWRIGRWMLDGILMRLDSEIAGRAAEKERADDQSKAWEETARQAYRDIEYYQGLLDTTAAHLGPEIYVSDDGTVNDHPLRAKVPDMVADLVSCLAASKAQSETRRLLLQESQSRINPDLSSRIAAEIAGTADLYGPSSEDRQRQQHEASRRAGERLAADYELARQALELVLLTAKQGGATSLRPFKDIAEKDAALQAKKAG